MAERNGNYTHYEDDGETEDYKDGRSCCFTSMHFDWERGAFTIEGAAGQTDLIPEFRGLYSGTVWSEKRQCLKYT